MSENVFVNSAGKSFNLTGISPLEVEKVRQTVEARLKRENKYPVAPMYSAVNAAGVTQYIAHDESTVQTDAEKAALLEYQQQLAALDNEVNQTVMQACFLCVDVDPLQDKLWIGRMRVLGIEVPADAIDCLRLYVETQVIKSTADLPALLTAVLVAGGMVNEEGARAAEATFQRELEKAAAAIN